MASMTLSWPPKRGQLPKIDGLRGDMHEGTQYGPCKPNETATDEIHERMVLVPLEQNMDVHSA